MKKIALRIYTIVISMIFILVTYFIVEYVYLKINFEKVDKEVKEYQDIPYLNKRLYYLEGEYMKLKSLKEETKNQGLVVGKILKIFSKYNVTIKSITREDYDEGTVYKASVTGNFRDVFLSFGEIENSFLPISFTKIYMSGDSENVNMVINFTITE
ncbi:MAG: hypothetical protein N2712_00495 [Brevinematales bacterium]|nr:hypothetical protein [Brevinematales bacterium]